MIFPSLLAYRLAMGLILANGMWEKWCTYRPDFRKSWEFLSLSLSLSQLVDWSSDTKDLAEPSVTLGTASQQDERILDPWVTAWRAVTKESHCSNLCEWEIYFYSVVILSTFVTGANGNYPDLTHGFSVFYIKYVSILKLEKQAIKKE